MFVVGQGPGDTVYGSTILPEEIFVYDPPDSNQTYLGHLGSGEVYSLATWNNKVYLCDYPGAALWRYTPGQPWSVGANPEQLVASYGLGTGHLRPRAMVIGQISGADKLFIGSRAGYGTTGGALAVYDLSSDTWVNYRSPFTADGII